MSQLIHKVNSVDINIIAILESAIQITVKGLASSSGWTNPRLEPVANTPQEEGIHEYNFVADPPSGITIPVLTHIEATVQITKIPEDFKGVKVHASTNSLEVHEAVEIRTENTPAIRQMEVIKGYTLLEDRIIFRVHTGGCTSKSSFEVEVNKGVTGMPPYMITLFRTVPDPCKGYFPEGIEITFTFEELGIEKGSELLVINLMKSRYFISEEVHERIQELLRLRAIDPIRFRPVPKEQPWPLSVVPEGSYPPIPSLPWPYPPRDPWPPFPPRDPWPWPFPPRDPSNPWPWPLPMPPIDPWGPYMNNMKEGGNNDLK